MYLTRRQKEVLDFIREHVEERGYAPTLQEIGRRFGLSSPATVYKHVEQLVQKGYLRKAAHQGRGLQLVDPEPIRTVEVPLLGQVAAGRPIEALTDPEMVNVPPDFVGRRPTYVLRVRGSSLLDEQIRDGDYLIVEDRGTAEDGETVIGLLAGEEVVVKRYYRQDGLIRLQPANPALEPMIVSEGDLRIRGIVLGVMRKYR
jgi:repressor LexA